MLFVGFLFECLQQILKLLPASGLVDVALVLHLRPGIEVVLFGFGFIQPLLGQESACQCAEGQNLHAFLFAEFCHAVCGALIEQGEADLVGNDLDAGFKDDVEMRRVEVGEAEVFYETFFL